MPTDYRVEPATGKDLLSLLSDMRPLAFQGAFAASGPGLFHRVKDTFRDSDAVFSGYAGDDLLCVFGIIASGTVLAPEGFPWMLTTCKLESHAKPFARRSKPTIQFLLSRYGALTIEIDSRDTLLIGWVRWLGFKHVATSAVGRYSLPFYMFRKES